LQFLSRAQLLPPPLNKPKLINSLQAEQ